MWRFSLFLFRLIKKKTVDAAAAAVDAFISNTVAWHINRPECIIHRRRHRRMPMFPTFFSSWKKNLYHIYYTSTTILLLLPVGERNGWGGSSSSYFVISDFLAAARIIMRAAFIVWCRAPSVFLLSFQTAVECWKKVQGWRARIFLSAAAAHWWMRPVAVGGALPLDVSRIPPLGFLLLKNNNYNSNKWCEGLRTVAVKALLSDFLNQNELVVVLLLLLSTPLTDEERDGNVISFLLKTLFAQPNSRHPHLSANINLPLSLRSLSINRRHRPGLGRKSLSLSHWKAPIVAQWCMVSCGARSILLRDGAAFPAWPRNSLLP